MLILASKSPRREELLKTIYPYAFKKIPADIDEDIIKAPSLEELPFAISEKKGQVISSSYPEDYVISADTIVIFQGHMFGKPHSEKQAIEMLTALNEKQHVVVTGYHIIYHGKDLAGHSVQTKLILHGLNAKCIAEYIKTGSPFDKAGAYGIQDNKYISYTIESGPYDNVMGFPCHEIKEDLQRLKLI